MKNQKKPLKSNPKKKGKPKGDNSTEVILPAQGKNTNVLGVDSHSTSTYLINAAFGLCIVMGIPYVANFLNRPVSSAILNFIPGSFLNGLFIEKELFGRYLKGIFLMTIFDAIFYSIAYFLYFRFNFSPITVIIMVVVIWLFLFIYSFFKDIF